MLVIDSHLDLAWNALQWNRDLRLAVYTIRGQEHGLKTLNPGNGLGLGTVALPEMRRARLALCFATLLARSTGHVTPHIDYGSPAQAYGVAQGQLAYYRALAREGQLRIITDLAGLDSHMAAWQAWDAGTPEDRPGVPTPPTGIVISMESADPILSPEHLGEWRDAGVRIIGPAHYGPGRYAGGTGTEMGLTPAGEALLAEMSRLGVILDMTHLSDEAFWPALELYEGPVLASHNNCRGLVPHQRQYSDAQLRAIAARGGVIGAAFDAWMLRTGWRPGPVPNEQATLAHVVDQIDYVCQLTGSARHAAIGSDLDGGFGLEQSPGDLDTIADLQRIPEMLGRRGYGTPDIAAIMHGNWLGLLRRAWAVR